MKNIKAEYTDYCDVIKQIGEDKINDRLCAIHDIYQKFLKESGFKDGTDISLNDRILMHAILDYFTDITRLRNFHDIQWVNQDKIIAYEASWILKRKPIQIMRVDKEEFIYVNEKFVLEMLINHLTAGRVEDFSKNEIVIAYCNILFYYMKYRNCDAKILEIIIASFKAGNSIGVIEYD